MKKILTLILATVILGSTTAFAGFTDVSSNYHLYKSIDWLEEQGVVVGYEDGTFRPDNYVNRAEFLKMLYKTIGMEDHNPTLPFPDVPLDEWYTTYVKEAYYTGIVVGYPDGYFRPENPINFAEALKIVTSAYLDIDNLYGDGTEYDSCHGIPLDIDTSVDTSAWYWRYVHVADELCILNFDSNANVWEMMDGLLGLADFDLSNNVTRADMAELLYRTKAVYDNEMELYTEFIFPNDIITDTPPIETPIIDGYDYSSTEWESLQTAIEERTEEFISGFNMPPSPVDEYIIYVSTQGAIEGEWPDVYVVTNKIYSYDTILDDLDLLYEEQENRILRIIGIEGSNIIMMIDLIDNSPGVCFSPWSDWDDFGYLDSNNPENGIFPYTVPEYKVEEETISPEECDEIIDQYWNSN